MSRHPLRSITSLLAGISAVPAGLAALVLLLGGRSDWAVGIVIGWLAGSLNEALLALKVSRLTERSTVAGFLYGMGSRFALIALLAIASYRLLGASPVGFAIGIAFVLLMNVPVSLIWSFRREPA